MYGKVQGVVVAEVEDGSPAAARGLRAGDVIVAVNRKPVRNVAEFQAALQEAGRVAALDVLRGDMSLFILIT
nr:PDZ domain-containing protein [Rhodoplanes elegans]